MSSENEYKKTITHRFEKIIVKKTNNQKAAICLLYITICNLKSKSHQTHWVDVFLDLYFAIYGRKCFNMPCISLFICVFFQDVVCCHYCETPFPPLHCDLCHQNICNDCEAKHVSETSRNRSI